MIAGGALEQGIRWALPKYEGCTGRGFVVALDPPSGRIAWKYNVGPKPERLDPPKRLLSMAVEMDCLFSVDTDAHAPGQLDWLRNGCERAVACEVPADRVLNTWPLEKLLAATRSGG